MSRSDSDIRRREQGVIIKRALKQIEPVEDIHANIPQGGCQYYGDTDLMKQWCPCCETKDCY